MTAAPSLRNELRLTRHVVAQLATMDALPRVDDLPAVLMEIAAGLRDNGDLPRRMHRTVVQRAASTFGLAYCWSYFRPDWSYAGGDVRAAAGKLEGVDARAQAPIHPMDPRLAWWTPAGDLVIDELHGTHLGDGLLDDWMRRRVKGDLAVGRALAGNRFVGVRICSLRAINASVLVTSLTGIPTPLAVCPLGDEGGMLR